MDRASDHDTSLKGEVASSIRKGLEDARAVKAVAPSRENSLVITKLEEAAFWADQDRGVNRL
jgi:hypothetical protein